MEKMFPFINKISDIIRLLIVRYNHLYAYNCLCFIMRSQFVIAYFDFICYIIIFMES